MVQKMDLKSRFSVSVVSDAINPLNVIKETQHINYNPITHEHSAYLTTRCGCWGLNESQLLVADRTQEIK